MKLGAWLFCLAPLTFAGAALGGPEEPTATTDSEAVVPTTPPFSRYEKMLSQSLFSPVTAPVQEEVPVDSPLSSKYFVVGVFSIGKTKSAIVENRESGEKTMLSLGGEPKNGLSLIQVEWSPVVTKSEVVIEEGGEKGAIKFDTADAIEPLVPEPMDSASVLNSRTPIGGGRNAGPAANINNNNQQNSRRRAPMGNSNGGNHNTPPVRTFQPPPAQNPNGPVRRRIINAPPSP